MLVESLQITHCIIGLVYMPIRNVYNSIYKNNKFSMANSGYGQYMMVQAALYQDYFLKMMKQQLKIKNFIKLINKIHSKKKEEPYIVIQEFQEEQVKQNVDCEDKTLALSIDEHNDKKYVSTFQGNHAKTLNQSSQIGIFFTQQAIKQRYDEKKSLYEVYRESLQRKKDHLTNLLMTKNQHTKKSIIPNEDISQTYEGNFPYNRNLVLKNRRESFTNQRILKTKKSTFRGNRSIPTISNESSQRFLKMEQKRMIEHPRVERDPKRFDKSSQMRKRKLDYKPLFRVKRLAFESNRTETAENDEVPKFQKYSHKSSHVKTEEIECEERKVSCREKFMEKKRRSNRPLDMNDKFSAWDNDHPQKIEENELISKFLL